MNVKSSSQQFSEVDDFIAPFEEAWALKGFADFRDFLPPPHHPLRLDVLRELIRIDMEFRWDRGEPRAIEVYLALSPELRSHATSLRDIVFEEYRLRRQAGQVPDLKDYERRFGIATEDWQLLGQTVALHGIANRETSGVPSEWGRSVDELPRRTATDCILHGQAPELAPLGPEVQAGDYHGLLDAPNPPPFRIGDVELDGGKKSLGSVPEFPRAGEDFLGFHLEHELGRGAFGRVFLAHQATLANRPVAVKVSPNLWIESQALAQLQHTNIVPIFSVHRNDYLHAVCMPYFGPTTLADVLKEVGRPDALPVSGKSLVATLNARRETLRSLQVASKKKPDIASETPSTTNAETAPIDEPAPHPPVTEAIRHLEGCTYVQAILWMGLRLADGLAHAHERGILHRDLKPANILLTDEGQPMLLDFNLSEDTKTRGGNPAPSIGGTLPYMAPEHLEALQDVKKEIDGRADVYGLGVILFELLTGRHPFPIHHGAMFVMVREMVADRRRGALSARAVNPQLPLAVEAIIARCLEADPQKRYASAKDLREDLYRQLHDLPLRFAPNKSIPERIGKWRRRHPRVTSGGAIASVALALIVMLALGLVARQRRLNDYQELQDGRAAKQQLAEDARVVAASLSSPTADPDILQAGRDRAKEALGRFSGVASADGDLPKPLSALPEEERNQVREWLAELRVLSAASSGEGALTEMESLPSPAGQMALQAWQALRKDDPKSAAATLELGSRMAPDNYWLWHLRGVAALKSGALQSAEAYFSVCVALWPESHLPYFERGLTHLRLNQFASARDDFDDVLKRCPGAGGIRVSALMNRALAYQGLRNLEAALADFSTAIELEGPTRLYLMRARIREALKDKEGAALDFQEGLRREPRDAESFAARGIARLAADPAGALEDFDQALTLKPDHRSALQSKAHVLSERLGRTEEAIAVLDESLRRQPDLTAARAGRGVLLARLGRRDAALDDARQSLLQDNTAFRRYQIACIYALTSKQDPDDRLEAFRLLNLALRAGAGWDFIEKDTDLDPIRQEPEFRRVVEANRALRQLGNGRR